MRWLTVRVPGQLGRDILLEKPGPPAMDETTGRQVRELIATCASGFTVEITQEPVDQPYGIDIGVRDPFGNHIRIVQLNAGL